MSSKPGAVQTDNDEELPSHLIKGIEDDAVVLIDKPVQPRAGFQVTVDWEVIHLFQTPYQMTQSFGFSTGAGPPALKPAKTDHSTESSPHTVSMRLGARAGSIRLFASKILRGLQVRMSESRLWVPCAIVAAAKRCTWVQKGHTRQYRSRVTSGIKVNVRPPGPWEKVSLTASTKPFVRRHIRYSEGSASLTLKGPKPKRDAH